MLKYLLTGCLCFGLIACSAQQIATAQSDIQAACSDVNAVAAFAAPFKAVPEVGSLLAFANASCATAPAVAALVAKADNNTMPWLSSLVQQIKNSVANASVQVTT